MSLGPRLLLRQSQSLVMTPQLRQAIQLLQFSNLEAAAFVEEELERNPLLERDEEGAGRDGGGPDGLEPGGAGLDGSGAEPVAAEPDASGRESDLLVAGTTLPAEGATPLDAEEDRYEAMGPADGLGSGGTAGSAPGEDDWSVEDFATERPSLRDHLAEQLRLNFDGRLDRLVGAHLIGLLDPAGRVAETDEAIAGALGTTVACVASVRERMMRFDPVGLFARDLRGCLAAQLAERNRLDPAMAALLEHLDLLAAREHRRLQALCGVDGEDLAEMIAELRALDPKPAASWTADALPPVIPDVLMRASPAAEWVLELNPETMPRVLVNQAFHARISRQAGREDGRFLAEKLATANWLVRSLQQRAQTILKVAGEIVRQQDGFFRHGISHLRPLILRDVAAAVELHESTVSRVTSNKYIATPRGTFELKYFFTTALAGAGGESHSAEAVRHRIRSMIGAETAESVLSDDAIVTILRKEGVDIARRTVAKYREALRIPSSVQRKREKAVPA